MKKTSYITILKISMIILFAAFTGCDTPSNPPVIPVTPSNPTTPTTETPTTPSNPSNPTNPTNPETPNNTPELRILTILPATHTFNLSSPSTVTYISGNDFNTWKTQRNGTDDFGYDIAENGNTDNLNLQINPNLNGITIIPDNSGKTGSITFRVWNRALNTNAVNYVSNYMTLNVENTVPAHDTRFVGTWVTTDQYLIDTIEFYSNGTMKQYNSQYSSSGYVQNNWEVKSANRIYFSGHGSSCTATYSFSSDLQTLRLTNYFGYNKTLTFRKQ